MDREQHKYKAIRKDNGEWIYGSLIQVGDSSYILDACNTSEVLDNGTCGYNGLGHGVYPQTVCEYINRKDVDFVDLYEHDICEFIIDGVTQKCEIVWDTVKYGYSLLTSTGGYHKIPALKSGKFIRNKYDNYKSSLPDDTKIGFLADLVTDKCKEFSSCIECGRLDSNGTCCFKDKDGHTPNDPSWDYKSALEEE